MEKKGERSLVKFRPKIWIEMGEAPMLSGPAGHKKADFKHTREASRGMSNRPQTVPLTFWVNR